MTDKLIRIKEDKHQKLVRLSKLSGRTVPKELDYILASALARIDYQKRKINPDKIRYMSPSEKAYLKGKHE